MVHCYSWKSLLEIRRFGRFRCELTKQNKLPCFIDDNRFGRFGGFQRELTKQNKLPCFIDDNRFGRFGRFRRELTKQNKLPCFIDDNRFGRFQRELTKQNKLPCFIDDVISNVPINTWMICFHHIEQMHPNFVLILFFYRCRVLVRMMP